MRYREESFELRPFRVVNVILLRQIYVFSYEGLRNYLYPFSILSLLMAELRDLQDRLLHPPECRARPGGPGWTLGIPCCRVTKLP